MANYNALDLQRLKTMQGTLNQQPVQVPYNPQSYADQKRAQAQASNDNNWQKMLQAAAMASMMDNKTALGFGLGSLLAANWDKWFGKKKKSADGAADNIYAANKDTAPPMNMNVDSNGVIHYEQPLPNGYELGNISYSGTRDVPPATLSPANVSFTQSLGLDNYKAQNPMDMSTNPANFGNFLKQTGTATNPWSMPAPSVADIQSNALEKAGNFDINFAPEYANNNDSFSEWFKKLGGGK